MQVPPTNGLVQLISGPEGLPPRPLSGRKSPANDRPATDNAEPGNTRSDARSSAQADAPALLVRSSSAKAKGNTSAGAQVPGNGGKHKAQTAEDETGRKQSASAATPASALAASQAGRTQQAGGVPFALIMKKATDRQAAAAAGNKASADARQVQIAATSSARLSVAANPARPTQPSKDLQRPQTVVKHDVTSQQPTGAAVGAAYRPAQAQGGPQPGSAQGAAASLNGNAAHASAATVKAAAATPVPTLGSVPAMSAHAAAAKEAARPGREPARVVGEVKVPDRRISINANQRPTAKGPSTGASVAAGSGKVFHKAEAITALQATSTAADSAAGDATTGQALSQAPAGAIKAGAATGDAGQAPTVRVADQIASALRSAGAQVDRQVVIQLAPPELGKVRVTLRSSGKQVRGVLETDNPDTARRLEQETTALTQRLEEAGVHVRRMEVVVNRQDSGPGPDNPLAQDGSRQGSGGESQPRHAATSSPAASAAPSGGEAEAAAQTVTGGGINVRI